MANKNYVEKDLLVCRCSRKLGNIEDIVNCVEFNAKLWQRSDCPLAVHLCPVKLLCVSPTCARGPMRAVGRRPVPRWFQNEIAYVSTLMNTAQGRGFQTWPWTIWPSTEKKVRGSKR